MLQRRVIRSVILAPSPLSSKGSSTRDFRVGRVLQGFSTGFGVSSSSVLVVRGAVNREGFTTTGAAAVKKAEDPNIKMCASSLSQIKLSHLLLMLLCVLYPLFMYSKFSEQPVEGGVTVEKHSVSMQRFPQ